MEVGSAEVGVTAHLADHSLETFASGTAYIDRLPGRKFDYLICTFLNLLVLRVLDGDSNGRFCVCFSLCCRCLKADWP